MDGHLVVAPMVGTVVHVVAAVGDEVRRGGTLLALESMKMEHPVVSPDDATVVAVLVAPGDTVRPGDPLVELAPRDRGHLDGSRGRRSPRRIRGSGSPRRTADGTGGEEELRADLAEVLARQAQRRDAARPEATRARHDRGRRTARENLADLVDEGSFVEYGGLAIAAQRARRPLEELIARPRPTG
jgi:pyruvate/2-oxoglutarate dehydrogenase complex dihydrolipoamide acyltransferase (E2) component